MPTWAWILTVVLIDAVMWGLFFFSTVRDYRRLLNLSMLSLKHHPQNHDLVGEIESKLDHFP